MLWPNSWDVTRSDSAPLIHEYSPGVYARPDQPQAETFGKTNWITSQAAGFPPQAVSAAFPQEVVLQPLVFPVIV